MNLISKRNFIIVLAAILVVGMAFMAISSSKKSDGVSELKTYDTEMKKIESQSDSDNAEEIEKDLQNTDFEGIDKEIDTMEKELDAVTL